METGQRTDTLRTDLSTDQRNPIETTTASDRKSVATGRFGMIHN